jgi:GT2 family glycosyltransferase
MNIYAVVVLYNCKIEDSKTINSLKESFYLESECFNDFSLMIYDNSKVNKNESFVIPFKHKYFHDPSNKGLASAYNYALDDSSTKSNGWMLLLDQDSLLPLSFISQLNNDINNLNNNKNVLSIVPKMYHNDIFFSPSKVLYGGTMRPINEKFDGIYNNKIFAIGSCSTVRISFLKEIKGFNEFFWMDSLDRWLYNKIEKVGGRVFVSNSIIKHELSVYDFENFPNTKRYRNIIKFETYFMILYKSKSENLIYFLRLFKRSIYYFFALKDKKYSLITFKYLLKVTFLSLTFRYNLNSKKLDE